MRHWLNCLSDKSSATRPNAKCHSKHYSLIDQGGKSVKLTEKIVVCTVNGWSIIPTARLYQVLNISIPPATHLPTCGLRVFSLHVKSLDYN